MKKWGNWELRMEPLSLILIKHNHEYAIDLESCKNAEAVLDWIFQVFAKSLVDRDDIYDLLRALRDTLHPQETLCSRSLGGVKGTTIKNIRATVKENLKRWEEINRYLKEKKEKTNEQRQGWLIW